MSFISKSIADTLFLQNKSFTYFLSDLPHGEVAEL